MAKILIIDDSPTEVHQLGGLLKKNGHDVSHAESGEAGIEAAEEQQPDVILMDVVMPGLNGFQATRHLSKSEKTGHIPVIIVSAKDQETDRVWGLRQGAKAFLTKPVSEKQLMDTLGEVLS